MYLHFAFGALGKAGELNKQADEFINEILSQKKLRFSLCEEFIPAFQPPYQKELEGWKIDHTLSLKLNEHKIGTNDHYRIQKDINSREKILFLPEKVNMLCFIDIALKQLKNSPHTREYGQLAVGFNNNFKRRIQARHVTYYTESSLFQDPAVCEYNKICQKEAFLKQQKRTTPELIKRKQELTQEIVAFRKPKKLFPSFENSKIFQASRDPSGEATSETYTYDRYPTGYDFSQEKEVRSIAIPEAPYAIKHGDYYFVDFFPNEVVTVLVPSVAIREKIIEFFKSSNWDVIPNIEICPGH